MTGIRRISIWILCAMLALPGCARPARHAPPTDGRVKVVASLFPHYDFARQVGGEQVAVTLLLPPGSESHAYDPKPSDIAAIYGADLFLYTGPGMEPWAGALLRGAPDTLRAVDLSQGAEPIPIEHDDDGGHEDDDNGHDEPAFDAHIWLDPVYAEQMVYLIAEALAEADPAGESIYRANAAAYAGRLAAYDGAVWEAVNSARRGTLVFGGKFAYAYFLRRYGLDCRTAYPSCASHTEPSLKTVYEIVTYIKENDIPCVYHEELSEARVAKSICEQSGAAPLLFSTAHNVTKKELEDGITFLDILYANLENIKIGLGSADG